MSGRCKINMALFGYREGHHLIASSVDFPTQVRQFLATVTDSSGAENPRGFQTAYTGIPVPDTHFYALFCTWPAPEMPRPGCVWSHVLLIDLADLARIPDLSILKRYFRRPDLPIEVTDFNVPLDIEIPGCAASLDEESLFRADFLLRLLYGTPSTSVTIMASEGVSWEEPVFAVWSQQWPKLRRDFTFSTGSHGDRGQSGNAFDLQIAPQTSRRMWGRKTAYSSLVVDLADAPGIVLDDDAWLRLALEDLRNPDSGLRSFFFKFGSDLKRPRWSYIPLAEAFGFASGDSNKSDDPVRLLARIGYQFPEPRDALRLKEYLISTPQKLSQEQSMEHALATVTFLFERPEAKAYSEVKFNVTGLASELWSRKKDWVVWQLGRFEADENATAAAFASAIANIIDPNELHSVSERNAAVAVLLIIRRKELAFYPSTWKIWGRTQQEIFDALTTLSLTEEEWAKIMGAMLIAATYVSVSEAVGNSGEHALPGAFLWLEDRVSQSQLPSQPWRDALGNAAATYISRTHRLPFPKLALAAWFCPINAVQEVISPVRADVNELAKKLKDLPPPLIVSSAFLLMTLGLRAKDLHGVPLIIHSFEVVNNALATRNHSNDSWELLSPELPYIGWLRDWDRCAKLKLAVQTWLNHYAGSTDLSLKDALRDL